jgi:lipoyl(octanoyl) transferase
MYPHMTVRADGIDVRLRTLESDLLVNDLPQRVILLLAQRSSLGSSAHRASFRRCGNLSRVKGVSHTRTRTLKLGEAGDAPRRSATQPHRYPFLDLGLAPYLPLQRLQGRLRRAVADGSIPGVLLLLEHHPVITLGSRGKDHDLRDLGSARFRGVDVLNSERGGQATLHAPGQLVSYPIVPIPGRDLSAYVRGLEETLMLVLTELGLNGQRRPGHPGVYVQDDKIASVGLRCQRWVASHGTSLNVDLDLSLFDLVVSCGEPRLKQTSIAALSGCDPGMDEIKRLYVEAAAKVFSWALAPVERVPYQEVEPFLGLPPVPEDAPVEAAAVPTAGFEPATPGSGGQCSIP